jgi:hypothetical protein
MYIPNVTPTGFIAGTTDSSGKVVLRLSVPKAGTSYNPTIKLRKAGYEEQSTNLTVRGDRRFTATFTQKPTTTNSNDPSDTTPPPTDTPALTCTPKTTPVSAAQACLTVRVKDTANAPVANAVVTSPGVISRGETNSEGVAGPFAIRLTPITNNGTTTFVARDIVVTATTAEDYAQLPQNLFDKLKAAFIAHAGTATQSATIQIAQPTSYEIVIPGFRLVDDTTCTTDCGECNTTSTGALNNIFSIKKAHAQASAAPGTATVCVSGRIDSNNPQTGLYISNLQGEQWLPGHCTPAQGNGGPYTKVHGHQFARCSLSNLPNEGTIVTFTIKGRRCRECTEVYVGSKVQRIKPSSSVQRVIVPATAQ